MEYLIDEDTVRTFTEHWRYIPTRPRDPNDKQAVLMLSYLIPGLEHIVARHYEALGWRHHPELAVIKPRSIVGGLFDDLVAYVPVDEADEPVVVPPVPYDPDRQPTLDDLSWAVKPVVTETFEERPSDD